MIYLPAFSQLPEMTPLLQVTQVTYRKTNFDQDHVFGALFSIIECIGPEGIWNYVSMGRRQKTAAFDVVFGVVLIPHSVCLSRRI
jgi:hypothetical protein